MRREGGRGARQPTRRRERRSGVGGGGGGRFARTRFRGRARARSARSEGGRFGAGGGDRARTRRGECLALRHRVREKRAFRAPRASRLGVCETRLGGVRERAVSEIPIPVTVGRTVPTRFNCPGRVIAPRRPAHCAAGDLLRASKKRTASGGPSRTPRVAMAGPGKGPVTAQDVGLIGGLVVAQQLGKYAKDGFDTNGEARAPRMRRIGCYLRLARGRRNLAPSLPARPAPSRLPIPSRSLACVRSRASTRSLSPRLARS